MSSWRVIEGDCVERMRELEECSVDAVVCDPPYGLSAEPNIAEVLRHWLAGDDYIHRGGGFMGKTWDSFVPGPATWRECYRVLKPGGHLLAFAGTRTCDLMGIAIRLAGFERRDTVAWLAGSGFPKSLDVSKAIDRLGGDAGAEVQAEARRLIEASGLSNADIARRIGVDSRLVKFWRDGDQRIERDKFERLRDIIAGLVEHPPEGDRQVVGESPYAGRRPRAGDGVTIHMPAADDITAPATPEAEQWDGWGTALKPAHEPVVVARKPLQGTVAGNVLAYGTGALNVDGCRIEGPPPSVPQPSLKPGSKVAAGLGASEGRNGDMSQAVGRWPANVVLDGEAARMLDEQTGFEPSRFFYVSKASRAERNAGLEGFEDTSRADQSAWYRTCNVCGQTFEKSGIPTCGHDDFGWASPRPAKNGHPTVKPIDLMRWLVRLVTPPAGTVLDPFVGSGTTGCAAVLEGFDFIGIEREGEYARIAEARIGWWDRHRGDGVAERVLAAGREREAREVAGQGSLFEEEAA